MGAYVGAFFVFSYIFISKNKWLSLLSTPIIAPFQTLSKSTEINLKPVYCGFQCASYFPGNLHHVLRIAIFGW